MGKSEVALDVALEFDGEIINADSQQVYRHMNVGTGKPTPEQRQKAPHHLIDIIDPDEEFNAALFRERASQCAQEIWSKKKSVILCGGTGLYIRALTHGLFVGPARNLEIRKRLEREAEGKGPGFLYRRLKQADPAVTSWIHPNDRQRTIRALEVFEATGKKMSQWQQEHGFKESPFETLKIGLNRDRAELYDLIDRRCDKMIGDGLVNEVKGLLDKGYSLDLKALQSVGYRHVGLYLSRSKSLEDAVYLMKRDTRHLAKRQLTWFRSDNEIRWYHPEKEREQIIGAVKEFLD